MSDGHKSDEKIVYVGDSRIRKKSSRPQPKDFSAYPGKSEVFVPNFLLKEWLVGAVVLVGFMVLVMSEPAPLGNIADPTNTAFIPMPDWYFLFLYQLLKYPYLAGGFKVLGTLVVPGVAFTALILTPFLDRGPERRFYRRPIASTLMMLSFAAVIYLTYVSWQNYQHELKINNITPEHIVNAERWAAEKQAIKDAKKKGLPVPQAAGIIDDKDPAYTEVYAKATCLQCHGDTLKGGSAPGLRGIGDKYNKEEMIAIMKDGIGGMGPGMYELSMQTGGLTEEQMDSLAEWLAKQKTSTE